MAPSLACQGTSAGWPGIRALSRSPLPKPRAGGVPQSADGLGAQPGGGVGVGWRKRTAVEAAPGTPARCRSPQAGAALWSLQPWAPPEPPVRRPAGPGEPESDNRSTPGFRLLAGSLETLRGGGRPPRSPPQSLPGGAERTAGRDPRNWRWPERTARGGPAPPFFPAPPCRRPAPILQSGFCGARRPAPRLRAPRGGWLRARRGWSCAPPRLHCCACGAQGSHAPCAPHSRPPGGSAARWHGPRGRPGLGLWAEALKAAFPPAGPRARPARSRPWLSGPACGQRSWV